EAGRSGYTRCRPRSAFRSAARDAAQNERYTIAMQNKPQNLVTMDQTDLKADGDRLREECGIFGIFGHPDAAAITALDLHALQHRGQGGAVVLSCDGDLFLCGRSLGPVGTALARLEVIGRLPGTSAIGHVRYSTTGETILRNVQPLFAELNAGGFAIG